MRRLRTMGICTVAVLAFGVAGVASAHAAEVGECLKTARNAERHYTAKYTDKACTAPATKLVEEEGKANKYEWSPGVTPEHSAFKAKTNSVEWVGAAGSIACKKSSTVGEWTGPTTSVQTTTYVGCEFKGAGFGECHSAGQEEATVVTNQVAGTLFGHGEKGPSGGEPAEGEVWDSLTSADPSGVQMEYLCAGIVVIRKLGSIAGVYTAESVNVRTKKDTIEFQGALGEEPGKFGEQDIHDEASIGGGPFEPAGQEIEKTTREVKNSGKIEIRP